MIEEGKDKLEWTRQVSLGMTKMMMVMMMVMISLMQLKSNEKSKHYGHGGILADFRLTQPSWTLWRSWSPARTTRTTCRRSSGPSTSLPSWPTQVQLNTLDSANIKNCFINTEWNIADLPRGPIKNNSMRKLAAKTLMEILPPEIEQMVCDCTLCHHLFLSLSFFCRYLFFIIFFCHYIFVTIYWCCRLLKIACFWLFILNRCKRSWTRETLLRTFSQSLAWSRTTSLQSRLQHNY